MGWLPAEPRPRAGYHWRIEVWASFLSGPEGLSETTVANYCWWASGWLEWLQEQNVPLRQISLVQVDRFMELLSSQGLRRVTLATAAKALRCFLRYAYEQGWCRRDLVQGVLSPRL
jgi:integrase/recombinase XerD